MDSNYGAYGESFNGSKCESHNGAYGESNGGSECESHNGANCVADRGSGEDCFCLTLNYMPSSNTYVAIKLLQFPVYSDAKS